MPPETPVTNDKLNTILAIINAALQGLTLVPGAQLAVTLTTILTNALKAWHLESGQPIDLTKIPLETPVQ